MFEASREASKRGASIPDEENMEDSFQPIPNWSDVALLAAIEQAFDATWPVIRAREAGNNKARMAELSMALSPVTPPRVMSPKETVPGGLS